MKKAIVLFVATLIAAHAFAEGNRPSVGLEVSYLPAVTETHNFSYLGYNGALDLSYSAAAVRVYVDYTYVIVSLGYRMAASDWNWKTSGSYWASPSSTDYSFDQGQLEFRVLGKFPVRMGSFTLTPMIGGEYTDCLSGTVNGTDFLSEDKKDQSDISLLGGLGIQFDFAGGMYIRPSFVVGYNLTAKREDSFYGSSLPDLTSSSGFEYEAAVAIGFVM